MEGDLVPQTWVISIHALREERDAGPFWGRSAGLPISIHALREERDRFSSALC